MTFVLVTLATYGISHIIALEDGPFDVFVKWRVFVGAEKQETWLQRGFACPMCISFWVALILCLVNGMSWVEWLAVVGAIRVIHILLYK